MAAPPSRVNPLTDSPDALGKWGDASIQDAPYHYRAIPRGSCTWFTRTVNAWMGRFGCTSLQMLKLLARFFCELNMSASRHSLLRCPHPARKSSHVAGESRNRHRARFGIAAKFAPVTRIEASPGNFERRADHQAVWPATEHASAPPMSCPSLGWRVGFRPASVLLDPRTCE